MGTDKLEEIMAKEFSLVILEITKAEHIEKFETQSILGILEDIKNLGSSGMDRVSIFVSGYDDDSRELVEIPEVVEYIRFLDRSFPYWFFFIEKDSPLKINFLGVIMLCFCDVDVVSKENGISQIKFKFPNQIDDFFNIHFHYLNELTDELGLSETVNRSISERVNKLFA